MATSVAAEDQDPDEAELLRWRSKYCGATTRHIVPVLRYLKRRRAGMGRREAKRLMRDDMDSLREAARRHADLK